MFYEIDIKVYIIKVFIFINMLEKIRNRQGCKRISLQNIFISHYGEGKSN